MLAVSIAATAFAANPKTRTQQLMNRLGEQEPLRSGIWGMLAVRMDGDTLVDVNSHRRMLPASNMKLITTGSALTVFGSEYRFKTSIGHSGVIRDGVLEGDLYIIGGADPTIGADFGCMKDQYPFMEWRDIVQKAGIRKISGKIVGDARFFDGDPVNGNWNVDDIIDGDGIGSEGLNYYRDTLMNHSGAYLCAEAFNTFLLGAGLNVPKDSISDEAVCDTLKVLGSAYSPKLRLIMRDCNYESDNFYAETFMRMLGKQVTGSACYDSCYVAMDRVLSDLGLGKKLKTIQIMDGSGLARKNYQTPDFLVSFLTAMAKSPCYETYRNTLPQPGKGTLSSRLPQAPSGDRARVYMKSGSMNGVRSYSGYIVPKDGVKSHTIVFSFLSNNAIVSQRELSLLCDKIIGSLATEN